MLSTKIKLYLESKGKVWRDEINNKSFLLQNDGSGDYIKTWNVSGVAKPTDSELDVFDSDKEEKNQVVRNTRKAAYGDIGEQLDEIYKDIDTWKARIKKIKDDNPKE